MTTYFPGPEFALAIESILSQTFEDLELLVVDDGSNGTVRRLLEAVQDPRIRLVELPENRGQTAALNTGLAEARGSWVARIDQDDLADRNRLERQLAAVSSHPSLALVGSWVRYIDEGGREIGVFRPPVADVKLRYLLATAPERLPFVHSAVLFSREAALAAGGYPTRLRYANDYGLWIRLAAVGAISNVPEFLSSHRLHPRQASGTVEARIRIADEVLSVVDEMPSVLGIRAEDRSAWQSGRSRFVMASAGLLGVYSRDRRGVGHALRLVADDLRRHPRGVAEGFPIAREAVRRAMAGRNELARSPYP